MICVPLKMEGEFSIMEFIEETTAINIFNPIAPIAERLNA